MGKNIQLKNLKSKSQEEETVRLKEAYKAAVQKQNGMRRTIYEGGIQGSSPEAERNAT